MAGDDNVICLTQETAMNHHSHLSSVCKKRTEQHIKLVRLMERCDQVKHLHEAQYQAMLVKLGTQKKTSDTTGPAQADHAIMLASVSLAQGSLEGCDKGIAAAARYAVDIEVVSRTQTLEDPDVFIAEQTGKLDDCLDQATRRLDECGTYIEYAHEAVALVADRL